MSCVTIKQRGAGAVQLGEQEIDDLLFGRGIEVAGGLVGQQQRRLGQEGPANGHPLLLALGEPVGKVTAAGASGRSRRPIARRGAITSAVSRKAALSR